MWWEKGGTPAEPCMVYPELFSDCFLTEQSVCMRQREYVCVSVAEGGDPTPPPQDCASLTGWRGRWGHCNKANTHTYTHTFFYGYVLASLALSRLHTSIFLPLSKTCSQPLSLADLPSFLLPRASLWISVCLQGSYTLPLPPISHPSLPLAPIPSSLTVW